MLDKNRQKDFWIPFRSADRYEKQATGEVDEIIDEKIHKYVYRRIYMYIYIHYYEWSM